jgi:hypothetical protein
MSTLNHLNLDVSLSDAVKGLRPPTLSHIRKGVTELGNLDEAILPTVIALARDALKSQINPDEDQVSKDLNLPPEKAIGIISAASFLSFILSSGRYDLQSFVREGLEVKLLNEELASKLQPFITAVLKDQPNVKDELEEFSLASEVLPALTTFDLTVDLRLKFKSNKVVQAVPIAIAHLDTDAEGQIVWFQMTSLQVEKLILDLQRVQEKLKAASELIPINNN